MPFIQISIREGRDQAAIRQLITNLTRAVVDALETAPETVRVIVTEVPASLWANGDVTLAEKQLEVESESTKISAPAP